MYRTIQAAAAAIRQGHATPLDLVEQCLRQIDKYEEKVRAWVFVDRDGAREEAERLTAELKAGQYRGPLHGIPIGMKDIIDVFDWPTAAGSKLWANSIAREDATIVKKLRHAGAIFLGKTVTTQYASFDPPPTRNPWDLERTPGGSSSGSAAALACGMCLAATATQTGGSITRPAAYCGVASCKPTYGRVSTRGVVPLAPSMDHPGVMARSVWDVAAMLEVIVGYCWEALKPSELSSPPRLGTLRGMFHELAAPSVREFMATAEHSLSKRGATLVEAIPPPEFAVITARHRTVMAVQAANFHAKRLKHYPEDYEPCITKLLREGLSCPALDYDRALQLRLELTEKADEWFDKFDLLLTPATTCPAPDKATTGDPAFNSPWSFTGLPAVSVPAGFSPDNMPLSIQLVGQRNNERELLQAAAWCEKVLAQPLSEPPI